MPANSGLSSAGTGGIYPETVPTPDVGGGKAPHRGVVVTVLRRLSVVILGVVVAGMLMVSVPGSASACSCMIGPLAAQLAAADVVFIGTPTSGDKPEGAVSSADPVRWTFDVDAVHRAP